MANDDLACYVYIQLPGTMETVPCASLKVRTVGAGAFEGTFTYGKRYLARPEVVALDPFHLEGVEQRSIEMLEQAMLPPSFFRDTPPDALA